MSIFENYKNLGKIKQSFSEYEYLLEGIEESKQDLEEKENEKKLFDFNAYTFICIIFSIVLIGQLLKLQITKGFQHQLLAEENRIRSEEIKAPRGIIFDRNKKPLVKNTPRYQLVVYPIDLPKDKSQRIEIYEQIKTITEINLEEFIKKIEEKSLYSQNPIILKDDLERNEALLYEIKFNGISSVKINTEPVRQYENVLGLSHILGYTGKITTEELQKNSKYILSDTLGKNGLESFYENILSGRKGARQIEIDAQGKVQRELATKEAIPGNSLITTLDLDLQQKTALILKNKLEELNLETGIAIVQDPRDGGILAMVSLPSYNNNLFSRGISQEEYQKILDDSAKPMLNRAISGTYPSGSTIKPMVAAAALSEGLISANTKLDTSAGEIKIGEWSFPDWKVHGITDVRQAIAESNDIFFYALGGGWQNITGLGIDKLDQYLKKFGLGTSTGIDLLGESKGLVPTPDWKKQTLNDSWYLGDTYHLAIGQGDLLVTPMQLLNATSAIANGGKLFVPHLIDTEIDFQGNNVKKYESRVLEKQIADKNAIQIAKEGMGQAVANGSARQLQDLPVSSGGKTGTAQFSSSLTDTHAWFTAFAPFDNPEVAITVLIEHGGGGDVSAEPVAKEILQYYFENKNSN